MEEQDHSPDQDMNPAPDTVTQDQDMINSNLLEEDQNQGIMIDCEHSRKTNTLPLLDALVASAITVTKTRRL